MSDLSDYGAPLARLCTKAALGDTAHSDVARSTVRVAHALRRVIAGAAVVFACLALVFHQTTGWWSDDSVMRFVQLQNLLRQGFQTASVLYPARDIDPEGRFFPAGPWFHVRRVHVLHAGRRFDAAVVERWTATHPWRFRVAHDGTVDIARTIVYVGYPAGPQDRSP